MTASPAEVRTETHRHIVCPGCGATAGFRYDHLSDGASFGPWACRECGVTIKGVVLGAETVEIELVKSEHQPALLLVRIAGTDPPVWFVLDHSMYRPDEAAEDGMRFLVEEHSCPTNFLGGGVLEVLTEGNNDPHGVLEYVQCVPKPEGFKPFEAEWSDWAMLFDRLPGQTIEQQVARYISGPQK